MKVRELISKLLDMDEDAEIVVQNYNDDDSCGYCYTGIEVEFEQDYDWVCISQPRCLHSCVEFIGAPGRIVKKCLGCGYREDVAPDNTPPPSRSSLIKRWGRS